MNSKRNFFIKLLTSLTLFFLVGMSLSLSASEFTVVEALNVPFFDTETAGSEVTFQSFWWLIAGLIGFISMTQRRGI